MTYYFQPDPVRLASLGYDAIAHVPVLFNSAWQYLREANWYLRERALCEWSPDVGSDGGRPFRPSRYPTTVSMENYARRLGNFLEWLEWRSFPWQSVDYTQHMVEGYQNDMLTGRWSEHGLPLKGRTVNARVDEACNFLRWAADKGLRPKFNMLLSPKLLRLDSGQHSHGARTIQVNARVGSVRADPRTLRLPTEAEVTVWRQQLRALKGEVKSLMADLVLGTGIRLQEVMEWRVDTLPLDSATWRRVGNAVQVTVKYGAKGPKYPDANGELHGPPRNIALPLELANRLAAYRDGKRLKQVADWVRAAPDSAERKARQRHRPQRLFLSEHTNAPFSDNTFYEAWTEVPALPFKGWSPHGGRHYWACITLLNTMRQRAAVLNREMNTLPSDWVQGQAMTDIDLLIRPQLGHVSRETTQLYLVWLQQSVGLLDVYADYAAVLEEDA